MGTEGYGFSLHWLIAQYPIETRHDSYDVLHNSSGVLVKQSLYANTAPSQVTHTKQDKGPYFGSGNLPAITP